MKFEQNLSAFSMTILINFKEIKTKIVRIVRRFFETQGETLKKILINVVMVNLNKEY